MSISFQNSLLSNISFSNVPTDERAEQSQEEDEQSNSNFIECIHMSKVRLSMLLGKLLNKNKEDLVGKRKGGDAERSKQGANRALIETIKPAQTEPVSTEQRQPGESEHPAEGGYSEHHAQPDDA